MHPPPCVAESPVSVQADAGGSSFAYDCDQLPPLHEILPLLDVDKISWRALSSLFKRNVPITFAHEMHVPTGHLSNFVLAAKHVDGVVKRIGRQLESVSTFQEQVADFAKPSVARVCTHCLALILIALVTLLPFSTRQFAPRWPTRALSSRLCGLRVCERALSAFSVAHGLLQFLVIVRIHILGTALFIDGLLRLLCILLSSFCTRFSGSTFVPSGEVTKLLLERCRLVFLLWRRATVCTRTYAVSRILACAKRAFPLRSVLGRSLGTKAF
jgi:hypothetical protein